MSKKCEKKYKFVVRSSQSVIINPTKMIVPDNYDNPEGRICREATFPKDAVIVIGREFGSGGRKIGKLIADILNIGYYDS